MLLRLHSVGFFILLSAIILMLGWLSLHNNFIMDWTYGKRNSLSQDTLQLLNSIDGKISIRSYQAKHPLYQKRAKEIFSLYQRHSKQLDFQLLDLNLEIDLAKSDGITQQGQSAIKLNGRSEIINSLSEQDISNALIRLHRNKRHIINFLSGHGERKISDTGSTGYYQLAKKLNTLGFELNNINLLRDDLLERLNQTLVIAAPEKPLLAGEIEQIKQFIELGGNLLWLQDPAMDQSLQGIAELLGLKFHNGIAIENDQKLRDTLGISHPAVIAVISYKLHAITKKMDYFTLFITAAALEHKTLQAEQQTTDNWHSTSLLLTQDNSWVETDGFILGTEFNAEKGDIKGPLSIGLALEREPPIPSEHNFQQRIVVIGDSDFVSNNNIGQGANLKFFSNSINWLTRDEQFISILPQTSPDIRLELSDLQKSIISIIFLIVLPMMFILSGLLIWKIRRRK